MEGVKAMSSSKKIGFYTTGIEFDGSSLSRPGGLGGSETAFIQLAQALARRGHEVQAFNDCQAPGEYNGVYYQPFSQSLPILAQEHFDIFISSRCPSFFSLPISASLKVLWNHDTLDNPQELKLVQDKIDIFWVLSNFHKNNFLTRLPQIDDRLMVTRNGLDFDLLEQSSCPQQPKDPHKLIYASRPERGLKILLEHIWPHLYQENPKRKLYICGYQIKMDSVPPHLNKIYKEIEQLIHSSPGIVLLGGLNKEEYYSHLREASLMLYPCTFPEISCIVALEAQALGVPVLTSNAYALAETVVSPQTKIEGRPASAKYITEYIAKASHLLSNPAELTAIGQSSQEAIYQRYSWDQIAAEWERIFNLNLKAKKSYHPIPQMPRFVENALPY